MEPILKNHEDGMPRTDYPRPQFKRQEWLDLNGTRQFAFDFGAVDYLTEVFVSGVSCGTHRGGYTAGSIIFHASD